MNVFVTYFSASCCISSRFCLRNSLRRSKSKSSSMIHTELLGYKLKERKTVRQGGIYKDLNCPDHFNSKSRRSLSAVCLRTHQDHNIPASWSISLEQLPGKANYATHLTSLLIFSIHGHIILSWTLTLGSCHRPTMFV